VEKMSEDDDRFRDYDIPTANLTVDIAVEAFGGISISTDGEQASYELICEHNIQSVLNQIKKLLELMQKKYLDKVIDPERLQKELLEI
jgi:hypothetical protein